MITDKSRADAQTRIAQFLKDVVTAAGLLSYGRTDKKLATRIMDRADELRTHIHRLAASPVEQPAAAPIPDRCYAPSCGKWDGNPECTCAKPAPSPADERAAWDDTRHSLAVAMCGFATRSGSRDLDTAISVLDAITEAGSPLSWLRTARASANETGSEGEIVVPIELSSVAETLAEGDGFWRSCSGCHETNEGHETGHYPYSKILKCHLGGGCSECGGIGAVWDDTDYEAMGRDFERSLVAPSRSPAMAAEAVPFEVTEQAAAEWASRHDVDHVLKHFSTQRNAIEDARTLHLLAAAPQPAPADARVGLTDEQRSTINALIELTRATFIALDDSEEQEGEDGRQHAINSANFDAVSNALDRLDELPDDKPGETLGAAGKAEWALRTLLAAHPGQPEPCAEVTLFADNDERDEFIRACQDFDDDGETCVDYGLLMKWAGAGLLDCDHFTITKKGRAAIDAARAGGA